MPDRRMEIVGERVGRNAAEYLGSSMMSRTLAAQLVSEYRKDMRGLAELYGGPVDVEEAYAMLEELIEASVRGMVEHWKGWAE